MKRNISTVIDAKYLTMKRKFCNPIDDAATFYALIKSSVPNSETFVNSLQEKKMLPCSILRMNHNHFTRLGLSEESSIILFDMFNNFKDSNIDAKIVPINASPLVSVAIIGTAGRKGMATKMSRSLFMDMRKAANDIILNDFKLSPGNVRLVSGGAAWSDHIAVHLFLNNGYKELTLYLPCRWISGPEPHHEDNGNTNWAKNAGKVANNYHKQFSSAMGVDTLREIEEAKKKGAHIVENRGGFHARNSSIANSTYMIAFSWDEGIIPISGGTANTWQKSKGHKTHVSLDSLQKLIQ